MGLRTPHYQHILSQKPECDWFEIISENFMDTDGRPKRVLAEVKEHYPIVMHGVSMSIGTTDPTNSRYMKQLKDLVDWLNPAWVSDHLCWTGVAHKNTHDLLPVPYTEAALKHIIQRIRDVQDYLERPLLIENPSTYLEFRDSHMSEEEFIARMAEGADCALLLDVNNVYVSCYNHRIDPKDYIDALPLERVVQIHLAGHTNHGTHIIDTHEGEVVDEVWALYRYVMGKTGKITTMVEWDEAIPAFDVVKVEVDKAQAFAENPELPNQLPQFDSSQRQSAEPMRGRSYDKALSVMQDAILSGEKTTANDWIRSKKDFRPEAQLGVYINAYRYRLFDVLSADYGTLRHYLGKEEMDRLLHAYIENTPSIYFNICRYGKGLPEFMHSYFADSSKGEIIPEFAYELALLEADITQIFDMRETSVLDTARFESIDPEVFLQTVLYTRAALSLRHFHYPVNGYYTHVVNEGEAVSIEEKESFVAIYRHNDSMWRLDLSQYEYELLSAIQQKKTMGEALELLLERHAEAEEEVLTHLQQWFTRWVSNGLLADAA